MRLTCEKGITLVELIITISIMAIIASAAIPLISTSLDAHSEGMARSRLYHEGLLAMERMTSGVRRCTYLLVPNAHRPIRDFLVFSGTFNDDNDFYFDDPLFPRIDEDPDNDINSDTQNGLAGFDDDGDNLIDENPWDPDNDDEDLLLDEDLLDGADNDKDGNIDEDPGGDANNDGRPGIAGMDDNGDGQVDNSALAEDDDEDGVGNEDPLSETVFWFHSPTRTLYQGFHPTGEIKALSERVTFFQVRYEAPERIQIALTLTGDNGESVQFVEYVYPRNTFQKTGKRVR